MSANTPEDVDRLFEAYVNAGNAEGVVGLYEADAVLLVPDGPPAKGTEAIRGAIQNLVGAKLKLQMHLAKIVRSADVAMLYNDWSGTLTGADGKSVEIAGKALEVVRRQADGTWRFVVDDPNARG